MNPHQLQTVGIAVATIGLLLGMGILCGDVPVYDPAQEPEPGDFLGLHPVRFGEMVCGDCRRRHLVVSRIGDGFSGRCPGCGGRCVVVHAIGHRS